MFPIILDMSLVRVMLIGNGHAALRRLRQLDAAHVEKLLVFSPSPIPELLETAGNRLRQFYPAAHDFSDAQVVLIADIDEDKAVEFTAYARAYGALINVEDRKPLCDFHIPSFVRRGDLLLSVSSGGTSPALAKTISAHLAEQFGPEWENYTQEIADLRDQWRKEKLPMIEISRRTEAYIREQGWLKSETVSEFEET